MHILLKYISKKVNIKFHLLNSYFNNRAFNLLDVGADNHSASRTTSLFSNCSYYGLDIDRNYSNDEEDFKKMKGFYELDLTMLDYSTIPNRQFDAILMTHVIEHLHNGDKILPLLIEKLKPGGIFYIEYPGAKSTKLPSMYGTLNFYDDPTHVRVYAIQEIKDAVKDSSVRVLSSGTRRNYYYIIAMPFRIVYSLIKGKKINANIFWDLLGFAEYVLLQKVVDHQNN